MTHQKRGAIYLTIMAALAAFMLLAYFLSGCTNSYDADLSTDPVAGMYHMTSGTYNVAGSDGSSDMVEFTEDGNYFIGVSQSGSAIDAFGCIGVLYEDNVVHCDTQSFRLTKYGTVYANINIFVTFEDSCMVIKGKSTVLYSQIGYAFDDQIDARGCVDEEMTGIAMGDE